MGKFLSRWLRALSTRRLVFRTTTHEVTPEEAALGTTLNNNIHPIHRQANFRAQSAPNGNDKSSPNPSDRFCLDNRTFSRILPSLRLAKLLLEFSLPFYTRVWNATFHFPNADSIDGYQLLADTNEPTDEEVTLMRRRIEEMADTTRIYCKTPVTGDKDDASREWAFTTSPRPDGVATISICSETFDFFGSEDYDKVSPQVKTSHLFTLALTLIHEQTHAIFQARWLRDNETDHDHWKAMMDQGIEPVYFQQYDAKYQELGFALEAWLFGGSIQHISYLADENLWLIPYPNCVDQDTPQILFESRDFFFTKIFWDEIFKLPRPPTSWSKEAAPYGHLGKALKEVQGSTFPH